MENLKQALNHGLVLKEVHSAISFNQDEWLKPYIEMNNKLRTEAKNEFDKDFFKLINNTVFGRLLENVRKHRHIKFVTTERRRNYLVSKPIYYTTTFFIEYLLPIKMRKTQIMNKPVYLEFSILNISYFKMYAFWYNQLVPKYKKQAKLCYMDRDNFIAHVKTSDIYKTNFRRCWKNIQHFKL